MRPQEMDKTSILKLRIGLIAAVLATAGCETIPPTIVDRYVTNANVLEFLYADGSPQIGVGSFDSMPADLREVACLSDGIAPPDNENYASYIRTSLITELAAAGRYSKTPSVTLTGVVEHAKLDFIKKIGLGAQGGQWTFVLTVNSSNGASVTVEASREYHTGWAPIRCHIAAEELMPAVQSLMYELITHGGFQSLLR